MPVVTPMWPKKSGTKEESAWKEAVPCLMAVKIFYSAISPMLGQVSPTPALSRSKVASRHTKLHKLVVLCSP